MTTVTCDLCHQLITAYPPIRVTLQDGQYPSTGNTMHRTVDACPACLAKMPHLRSDVEFDSLKKMPEISDDAQTLSKRLEEVTKERDRAEKTLNQLGYKKHGLGWTIVVDQPCKSEVSESDDGSLVTMAMIRFLNAAKALQLAKTTAEKARILWQLVFVDLQFIEDLRPASGFPSDALPN
jgi:hypothetical protein